MALPKEGIVCDVLPLIALYEALGLRLKRSKTHLTIMVTPQSLLVSCELAYYVESLFFKCFDLF
jgi:hypothetical protein